MDRSFKSKITPQEPKWKNFDETPESFIENYDDYEILDYLNLMCVGNLMV